MIIIKGEGENNTTYDRNGRKERKIEKQLPKIGEKMGVEVEAEVEQVEVGKVGGFEQKKKSRHTFGLP